MTETVKTLSENNQKVCYSHSVLMDFTSWEVRKQKMKKAHPLQLQRVMQSVKTDQRVGEQGQSGLNRQRRRGRKMLHEDKEDKGWKMSLRMVWLVWVVHVDVLQELGTEGCIGSLSVGKDLQHMAIVRA